MKPQAFAVLTELRKRGRDGLSPREAETAVGTWRLSGRILELRRAGYLIVTLTEPNAEAGWHARYVLVEDEAA